MTRDDFLRKHKNELDQYLNVPRFIDENGNKQGTLIKSDKSSVEAIQYKDNYLHGFNISFNFTLGKYIFYDHYHYSTPNGWKLRFSINGNTLLYKQYHSMNEKFDYRIYYKLNGNIRTREFYI